MDINDIQKQSLEGIQIAIGEINRNKVYFKITKKKLIIKSLGKINLLTDEEARLCLSELTEITKFKTDFNEEVIKKIWEYENRAGHY